MIKRFLPVVLLSLLLAGCTLPQLPSGKKAGLQVSSFPVATVFLDGNSLGTTPIQKQENLKPGQATVKIVPQDVTLQPYETQVTLTSGVLTVINRKFSANPDMSNGYTLSFEAIANKKTNQITITTLPSAVSVNVDGNPQDFTPTLLDTVAEGDHRILLNSPGYEDQVILARTINGYKLIITAQLAKKASTPPPEITPLPSTSPTPSVTPKITPKVTPKVTPAKPATPSAITIPKPYVQITSSVGWANVRSTPSTTASLLGKVNNGEAYPYLSTNDTADWIQIQFNSTTPGWINAPYVTVVK